MNFQEPLRRTSFSLDTVDLVLDLVVAADGSWRTKDEDDFAHAVSDGHLSHEVEKRVRAEADRMTSAVEAGGPPFCESEWLSWRPPAAWVVPPALPENWATDT